MRAALCPVALYGAAAAAVVSLSLIDVKMLLTCLPASVRAATATSEISATSSAYSMRSWPSSSRTNILMLFTSFMSSPSARPADARLYERTWRSGAQRRPPGPKLRRGCRRRRQLVLDRGKDVVDLLAGVRER